MNVYLALANEAGGYVFKNVNIEQLMNVYLAGYSTPWGGEVARQAEKEIMDIYLAGASSGNNNYLWKEYSENPDKAMGIFLAGTHSRPFVLENKDKIFVLESFYYIKEWMFPYIKNHWNFMLDSGAFTFMSDSKNGQGVNWDEYTERYADLINELNIDLFIELDIDSVVGIKEVERLRNKLEKLTNKKSIPVWHRSRGKDYWFKMCEEYDYVAIGGIVTGEIKRNDHHVFRYLISEARKRNTKVHGLGFTTQNGLKTLRFESVDSTAWIYGNRGGFLYKFNGEDILKIKAPQGKRLKARQVAIYNFKEWVKFQKYAINNL